MRTALLIASLLAPLTACGSPPPAATPRPTGVDSRAFVGEAELIIRYRYVPLPRYAIELFVDLSAEGGDGGDVDVTVQPEGFDVTRGPLTWSQSVSDGATESQSVELRAGGSDVMSVSVVTTRGDGGAELASDTIRFVVDREAEIVRECRPTDKACTP